MLQANHHFDLLAAQIFAKLSENQWRTFGVTSARQGEGKSTVAHRLALSMARERKHTVMLVDLNVFNPCIHQLFNRLNDVHLGKVLSGKLEFSAVIQSTDVERLKIVANDQTGIAGADLMSSFTFESLIAEISQRYADRICIFDMPSYLDSNAALTVTPFLDSLLLVVRDGVTQTRDLQAVSRLVGDRKILGLVLNDMQS
jgi:protein-tyrosine kinase